MSLSSESVDPLRQTLSDDGSPELVERPPALYMFLCTILAPIALGAVVFTSPDQSFTLIFLVVMLPFFAIGITMLKSQNLKTFMHFRRSPERYSQYQL